MNLLHDIGLIPQVLVFAALFASIFISYSSIPSIVRVANQKKLFDEPGHRKLHIKSVPTLGGIAIYAATLVSMCMFADFTNHREFQYIIAASVMLFFIGIKDDILIISPKKKLIVEIFAALILIVLGNYRFTSLHGFLGINEMNYYFSVALTLFVYIVIINGFNLIDGIDGLASGVGIISSLVFGTWFYLVGEYEYAIVAASLAGALISFFRFNISKGAYKIFMGDTGSLIVGYTMAVLATRFCEMNVDQSLPFAIHSAPAVAFGILIVPLFDTMRVFLIRILKGGSPFKADRNHVHHKLLEVGMSHLKATAWILTFNLAFVTLVLSLNRWGIIDLMMLIIGTATVSSLLPEMIYKKRIPFIHTKKR